MFKHSKRTMGNNMLWKFILSKMYERMWNGKIVLNNRIYEIKME